MYPQDETKQQTKPQSTLLTRVSSLFSSNKHAQPLSEEQVKAFAEAISHGDFKQVNNLIKNAKSLNNEQALLAANNFSALINAAEHGQFKIVERLIHRAKRKECLEPMLSSAGAEALYKAVKNNHPSMVKALLAELQNQPESIKAVVRRLSYQELRVLTKAGGYDYKGLEPLLGDAELFSKLEDSIQHPQPFERECLEPFMYNKLQELHQEQRKATKQKQLFDLQDDNEIKLAYALLRRFIRDNKPESNPEIAFLLSIPALNAQAHRSSNSAIKANELLKHARVTKNTLAIELLQSLPAVQLVEQEELGLAKERRDIEQMAGDLKEAMRHGDPKLGENKIPHKIHLFWARKTIPKKEAENIISWLEHSSDDWQIYLWLSDFNHLAKAEHFSKMEKYPARLVLKDLNQLINDQALTRELEQKYPQYPNIKESSLLSARELIGLGNPAAAKDGLLPRILIKEGGYFFDLDAEPKEQLKAPLHAPRGMLLINKGQAVQVLAAEKQHPLCASALHHLVENYTAIHQQEAADYEKKKSKPSPYKDSSFLMLQALRENKSERKHAQLTETTSGKILSNAYTESMQEAFKTEQSSLQEANFDTLFDAQVHLPIVKGEHNYLKMGVALRTEQVGTRRKPKTYPHAFDDMEPELQRLTMK